MPKDLTKLSLKEFEAVSLGGVDKRMRWNNGKLELRVHQGTRHEARREEPGWSCPCASCLLSLQHVPVAGAACRVAFLPPDSSLLTRELPDRYIQGSHRKPVRPVRSTCGSGAGSSRAGM